MEAAQLRPAIWTRDFVLTSITSFALFTSFYFLLPTLPDYVDLLGGEESQVGLIIGIFTISALILRPLIGRELDRRGRRGILLGSLAGITLITFLYGAMSSLMGLFLLRVLHGVAWAASTTAASTLVADLAPALRRGEALGYFGMFANGAMAIGPAVGASLARGYGFPVAFGVAGLIALLSLAPGWALNEPASVPRIHGGALIHLPALLPSMVMFFLTLTYGSIVSFVPVFVKRIGLGDFAGLYFSVYALFLLFTRPIAGRLYDRLGRRAVITPAVLLVATSLAVLAFTRGVTPLLAAAALNGMGFGSAHPSLMALVVEMAGDRGKGAAMATFTTFFDLGIGLGSILLGIVLQEAGFKVMFLAASFMALAALGVFWKAFWRVS